MPISCDPNDLAEASKCFLGCLSPAERSAIQTYLLAVKAGGSLDPQVLLRLSSAFLCCLNEPQMKAVQVYLGCQLVNGGSGACANLSGAGSPEGTVTPDFIGQFYVNTLMNPDWLFQSTGLTSADWIPYGRAASGSEGIFLNETSETRWDVINTGAQSGLNVGGSSFNSSLVTFSAPYLTSVYAGIVFNGLTIGQAVVTVDGAPALTTVNMPALQTAPKLRITGSGVTSVTLTALTTVGTLASAFCNFQLACPALTSIALPSLVTVRGGLAFNGSTNLVSVTLPVYLPSNGMDQNFLACALNQTTVDLILARCVANAAYVSGTVTLNGGTNSTPSAAGLADKATLVGRGCVVTNN